MSNVSALVLIYDIRGFTAATKRMKVHEIGAFATKAHQTILDVFAAHPPTFVKNLGDGHLLIWETEAEPDPVLVADVVAGAARARTAFTAFVMGHAAAGEDLPKHVGIGVAHGEVSKSDDYYGVALNLAARLQNLARPEGLALDQGVFDVVAKRDQAMRTEFRRSKVRLKGLGSTTVFVKRPFSWRRLMGQAAPVAAAVLVPSIYLLLADAKLGVPGGDAIRLEVDRLDLSLFRAAKSKNEIQAAADEFRRDLTAKLLDARTSSGWIAGDLGKKTGAEFDVWSSSQSLCALLGASHLSVDQRRPLLDGLAIAFRAPHLVRAAGGAPYGWLAHPGFAYTEAEPLFWTIAALARALGSSGPGEGGGDIVPADRRDEFLGYLHTAQEAAKFHHPLEDGGWNMFPNQRAADGHSPYTTTLALLALLEARSASVPWDDSVERRDDLLRATAAWFAKTFVSDSPTKGWRRTQDPLDVVSPGLTYQIYSLLLRAERDAGISIPAPILSAAAEEMETLTELTLGSSSSDAGEFAIDFLPHDAKKDEKGDPVWMKGTEGINFLWHPWAIATARLWLERAERLGAPAEDRVRIRRALGHLVVDMRDEVWKTVSSGYTFMAAETLYGLETIPPR